MVICIQRKKPKSSGVYPVTKKIRGTHHTRMFPSLAFCFLAQALCWHSAGRLPAQRLPLRSTSFCCQGWFKTVTCKGKKTQTKKPVSQPLRSLCVYALLEETGCNAVSVPIPPLWTPHADTVPCNVQSRIRRHEHPGPGNTPGPPRPVFG